MIDCSEFDSMIEICGKLDKSNTILYIRSNISFVLFHGTSSDWLKKFIQLSTYFYHIDR